MRRIVIALPGAAAYRHAMRGLIRGAGSAVLIGALGCGGGRNSPSSPTATIPPATRPVTVVVSGTTVQTGINGCSGDSHSVTVAEGDLAVTLNDTSDPAGALSVQLCQGANDTGTCSIKQQRIATGQTVTGVRVGSAGQLLKFLPYNCVFGNTFDPTPVTYRATLTYQQ